MTAFGIYVHWPFCSAKCPYCDFNSHVRTTYDEDRWSKAIIHELKWVRDRQGGAAPEVQSIFFGGGTPSLMSGRSAAAIIDAAAAMWPVANNVEITLEANPASADARRFRDYRAAGVNRLSLGVQALNDADLKFLGRLHNVAEAIAALKIASALFANVSLDLIYARPGQSPAAWRHELAGALALETEHLSLYQLTIEAGTPFAILEQRGGLSIPDEERAATLFELTQEMTEKAGRRAYEISNHALKGHECRHNLLYWRYGDYAGVGPGAHGRLTIGNERLSTTGEKLPERWFERVAREGRGFADVSAVRDADAAREHLLMNLRLREGVDLPAYESRWNVKVNRSRIAELAADDFVRLSGGTLAATERGRLVLNSLIATLAA